MGKRLVSNIVFVVIVFASAGMAARTVMVRDTEGEVDQIIQISRSQIQDNEKFVKILKIALVAEGGKRGGPDVAFQRRPNWYSLLMPFVENADAFGSFGPYREADLSFLKKWVKAKDYEKLRQQMVGLGYLDEDGKPKKRSIREVDAKVILEYAMSLYAE